MKKFLLLVMAVCFAAVINAQTVRSNRTLPQNPKLAQFMQTAQHPSVPQLMETGRLQQNMQTSSRRNVKDEDLVSNPVTPPKDLDVEDYTFKSYFNHSNGYELVSRTVSVGFDGNDVYISGLSYYLGNNAWTKGVLSEDGKHITFQSPQFYGTFTYESSSYDIYFIVNEYRSQSDDTYPTTSTVEYDPATGEIIFPEYFCILEGSAPVNAYQCYGYHDGITLTKGVRKTYDPVTLPADAEKILYTFRAQYPADPDKEGAVPEDVARTAYVAFVGSDVYISGLSDLYADAWVKGTLSGNKATFAANQYLGTHDDFYDFFLSPNADVVFDFDTEKKSFTCSGYQVYANTFVYEDYINVSIGEFVEVAGTPADPLILMVSQTDYGEWYIYYDAPTQDTNGNPMRTSKLFMEFFVDIEGKISPLVFTSQLYRALEDDITSVPYDLVDEWDFYKGVVFLNMDFSDWNQVGLRSVYTGGGETHATEIQWYFLKDYDDPDGINNLTLSSKDAVTYDLSGRVASKDAKGLLIKGVRQNDGTVKMMKVYRK